LNLGLAEELIKKGSNEGFSHGQNEGIQEGKEIGWEQGFDLGVELGQYLGSIETWLLLSEKHPNVVSERTKRALIATRTLIHNFEFDPEQPIMYQVETIRNKYQTLSHNLGILLSTKPTSQIDLSF